MVGGLGKGGVGVRRAFCPPPVLLALPMQVLGGVPGFEGGLGTLFALVILVFVYMPSVLSTRALLIDLPWGEVVLASAGRAG